MPSVVSAAGELGVIRVELAQRRDRAQQCRFGGGGVAGVELDAALRRRDHRAQVGRAVELVGERARGLQPAQRLVLLARIGHPERGHADAGLRSSALVARPEREIERAARRGRRIVVAVLGPQCPGLPLRDRERERRVLRGGRVLGDLVGDRECLGDAFRPAQREPARLGELVVELVDVRILRARRPGRERVAIGAVRERWQRGDRAHGVLHDLRRRRRARIGDRV
jgi:hypothetical protein